MPIPSSDVAPLIAASGIPVADYASGVLVGDAALAWGDGKWTLSNINGRLDTSSFSGEASLTPAMLLDARFDTGPLRLRDVMAAAARAARQEMMERIREKKPAGGRGGEGRGDGRRPHGGRGR